MPVNPGVESLPRHLRTIGSWTLRTVDDLPRMRASLEARLRADCPSAQARGRDDDGAVLSESQRIVLVTSELVANGLEHAVPPITVRLLTDGEAAVLDVVDGCPEAPPVVPDDRGLGQGGHGLRLAAAVADRVCWYRTAEEKHVWARFDGSASVPGTPPVQVELDLAK